MVQDGIALIKHLEHLYADSLHTVVVKSKALTHHAKQYVNPQALNGPTPKHTPKPFTATPWGRRPSIGLGVVCPSRHPSRVTVEKCSVLSASRLIERPS